jgi:hypothetical protein
MNSNNTSNSSLAINSKSVEGIKLITKALKTSLKNQVSGSSMRTITSGMTIQEIYKTNPLTAVDMAHLSPSLLLKLLGEPNIVLSNNQERKAYTQRIQNLMDELAARATTQDRATKSI